jgi:hypothetical protein
MMQLKMALVLAVAAVLLGCAHPMTIKPDIEKVAIGADARRIERNVGLYVSGENRDKEVTTPGGGGDKVSYRPYADMEAGLYKALSNVFQSVSVLHSSRDADSIAKYSVAYIIEPEISTSSSSSGVLTWMATDFTVQVNCRISDIQGHSIATVSSAGTGHAEFGELKSNFSIAGQRASQDALLKLQELLLSSPELRK